MVDLGLEGARAIVVGAGLIAERGHIGACSALELAAAGATVACVDVDAGRAADIVARIEASGGRAFPTVGDVQDSADAKRVVEHAVGVLGGVDVCVDIVGGASFERSDQLSDQQWRRDLSLNLDQVFYIHRAVASHMVQQGTGGAITTVTSVDGLVSSKYHVAYGAAKAGVISLVKTFSEEFGPHGVRVNAVAPGNVGGGDSDQRDVGFGGDPRNTLAPPRAQDIANAVLFLSSALSARITGQTLVVDGGATTKSPWGFGEETLPVLRGGLATMSEILHK